MELLCNSEPWTAICGRIYNRPFSREPPSSATNALDAMSARRDRHHIQALIPHSASLAEGVPTADDVDGLGEGILVVLVWRVELVRPLVEPAAVVVGRELVAEGVHVVGPRLATCRGRRGHRPAIEVVDRALVEGACHLRLRAGGSRNAAPGPSPAQVLAAYVQLRVFFLLPASHWAGTGPSEHWPRKGGTRDWEKPTRRGGRENEN